MFHHEPPLSDGSVYNLEASGDKNRHARNLLEPHELRGICGRDIPACLSIAIENPESHLKNMSLVTFDNLNEGPIVRAHVFYDHANWHLPIHLADFCELLRDELLQSKDLIRRVDIYEYDASITLSCVASIASLEDCFNKFQALDDLLLKSFRVCLRSLMKNSTTRHDKEASQAAGDGHGAKWWIRYVVVPLVVAVVALIALLLR